MIAELKDDELINRFGGRFKLCAAIQIRWRQLLQGARPMVDPEGLSDLEVVIREIKQGKVILDTPRVPEETEQE